MSVQEHRSIAIVSNMYGVVNRGAERIVSDLRSRLRGDVSVISMAGVCNEGRELKRQEVAQALETLRYHSNRYAWYDRMVRPLFRDRFRCLTGTYDFFSSQQLLDYVFSARLPADLDAIHPEIVLSFGGLHTVRVLNRYCRQHGIPLVGHYGGAADWGMRIMARHLSHGIVVSTPKDLAFLREREADCTSCLIPPGVDTSFFTPGEPKLVDGSMHRLPRPIIFSASAFDSFKRIHLLIDAVASCPKGSLLLAGDGPQRAILIERASEMLGPARFHYTGILSRQQLREAYRFADVYCLPSINEPFGIVLIEAMACNKPIVATDDVARRWIIGEAGRVTDVTNTGDFASTLIETASGAWDEKPRRRAESFSLTSVVDAWNALIDMTLKGKGQYTSWYEQELSQR